MKPCFQKNIIIEQKIKFFNETKTLYTLVKEYKLFPCIVIVRYAAGLFVQLSYPLAQYREWLFIIGTI
jgi:hypothetical protein